MGFENRDYFRDGSYTDRVAGWGVDFTPVVKYLILANVAVFLLQIFVTRTAPRELPPGIEAAMERAKARAEANDDFDDEVDPGDLDSLFNHIPGMRVSLVQEWLELNPRKTVYQGQVWRLLTCAFCHHRYSPWHIVFNMLLLYWFGTRLESMYGSREFLLFYLTAAVCGSVAYVALALYTGSNAAAIGASGAVMGVMMLYAIYYPFETITLFWILPVPIWILLSIYVIFDLHPVLMALAGDRVYTGVAHAGHLGGLAFGFVYWRLGLRLEAPFERGEGRRVRPRVHKRRRIDEEPEILAHPRRDVLTDEVDDILKKISESGMESLTAQEQAILKRASAKYRGKN